MVVRKARDAAHAGAVWTSLARLRNILQYGYAALRRPTKAKPKQREIVIRYFILHGLVTALGQVREAVQLLIEVQPSLRPVIGPYEGDLALWKQFRDDAAHVVDRTHRVSSPLQNDAVIDLDKYGYDTDVLKYEEDTDTVRTGLNDALILGSAIGRVEDITFALGESIVAGYRNGTISPPLRHRARN